MKTFRKATPIHCDADALRAWHFRDGAFDRLLPPWERAEIIEAPASLAGGDRAIIDTKIGPITQRWIAEHELTDEGFVDRQAAGPFAEWTHHHRFLDHGERSELVDDISYRLPFGKPGEWFGGWMVRSKLERMFRYRHEVTRLDLERAAQSPTPTGQHILVSGATGLVGTALCGYLRSQGQVVHRITRTPREAGDISWDPENGSLHLPDDCRPDAVIHLAGENIGARWTAERRKAILDSRIKGTSLLAETLANHRHRPHVLISLSGVSCYPATGEPCDETSEFGDGFLSEVVRQWEEAADPARDAGIRVVHPRLAPVLTPAGGALAKLLPLFQLCLGGRLGSGQQHFPWIAMDDVVDLLHRAIFEDRWEGAINFVAPDCPTQSEFASVLGAVLRRPAIMPTPTVALQAVFGQMARETLLADVQPIPRRLVDEGYQFRYPDAKSALAHLLGRR
ncbi:MAG: TIGR01777 family oxidoreductase [Verrucomicrobiota bacterium]